MVRRIPVALLVAALLPMIAGCGSTSGGATTATALTGAHEAAAPVSPSSGWLMTRQALSEVITNPTALQRLDANPIDELLAPGQTPLGGVSARIVVSFSSAATLRAAVLDGGLPPHTYGVLFDPEAWAFTPAYEQQHPVLAATAAAATAHDHGLRFFVAPALNLVTVLTPSGHGSRAAEFLAQRLPGRVGHDADVVELQSQSLERNTAVYGAFVAAGAREARAANPRVRVLAGLSTNPPGAPVTLAQLRADVAATRTSAQGYWLNIPGQGSRCPTCNPANPGIAVALILGG
jgi:hypothetical protein